jgi:putative methionine-R-sulfoxide reductase with GAF domain
MTEFSDSFTTRDYAGLLLRLEPQPDRAATMQHAVDMLWDALSGQGVSWIGFYLGEPGGRQMVLGPSRNKPACSPIGLHGMCGRSWVERRAIIVRDVATLGENYIACDPRDRSEVVLPLIDADGTCWGVLDADSYDIGAFDERDVEGLSLTMVKLGLSTASDGEPLRL